MNLKNYTSTVPMANSISRIEHRLAQAESFDQTTGKTFYEKIKENNYKNLLAQ